MTASGGPGEVTRLIAAISAGDREATDRLFPLVYDELRKLARGRVAREIRPDAAQPTSLVHEAYLRLLGDAGIAMRDRAYFFAAAGEAMRRILVERARRRNAVKRGGNLERITLDDALAAERDVSPETMLAIDVALGRLQRKDPRMSDVVKLRVFAGLTVAETAEALELSQRTVHRLWIAAHAWLRAELRGDG